jgi:hypothetical protein
MGAVVQSAAGPSGTKAIIPKSDLRPGDVLLSCGTAAISELIRRIDGGLYSHAAIWDGQFAVDATDDGVVRRPLEKDEAVQWFIDAYRWHEPPQNGPDLGSPKYPAQPVLDETDKIVDQGTQFAYDQLVLAALVIWLSNRPTDKWLRRAARLLLSRFEVWFVERIRKPGKISMVCSEIVARSFDQARRPPDYSIEVIVDGSRDAAAIAAAVKRARAIPVGVAATMPDTSDSAYDALKRRYGEILVQNTTTAVERQRLLEFAAANILTDTNTTRLMRAGDGGIPPSCVTPRDLQRSPNLRLLGRLSENPAPALPKSTFKLFLMLLKEFSEFKVKRAFKLQRRP